MEHKDRLDSLINAYEHTADTAFDRSTLNFLKELREYREASEQGLILKLPCKVGDILYMPSLKHDKVETLPVRDLTHIARLIDDECIGQYVFLTREEAEEALKQMREKMEVRNETYII